MRRGQDWWRCVEIPTPLLVSADPAGLGFGGLMDERGGPGTWSPATA